MVDAEKCITAPWFAQSDWAAQFVDMLYRSGWVLEGFDWPQWAETTEGRTLLSDFGAIAAADSYQIARLMTSLVRQDRLFEGTLAKAFERGVLLAAAKRTKQLLRQQ